MSSVFANKGDFSVRAYRGDAKTLLAFNLTDKSKAKDLAGFTIKIQPKGLDAFYIQNNLRFEKPGDHAQDIKESPNASINAPIHKFRWLHVPGSLHQGLQPAMGDYTYTVTPRYFDANHSLTPLDANLSVSVVVEVDGFTKGNLELGFTRGFTQSQAFVNHFGAKALIRPKAKELLFDTSKESGVNAHGEHYTFDQEYQWLGFTAREKILELLNDVVKTKSLSLDVFAYDLNEPEVVSRLEALGKRLKLIVDDSADHGKPGSAEEQAAKRVSVSAGAANVKRQHMLSLQHNKTIVVDGPSCQAVVCGSTNFSWRGFFVQSNNAVVLTGAKAVQPFAAAFDQYFDHPDAFGSSPSAEWVDLGFNGIDAKVAFSPHAKSNALLKTVADDIQGSTTSSLFYSLAFLFQTPGPVHDAIAAVSANAGIFVYGISDKEVGGLVLQTPDGNVAPVHPEVLKKNVPVPFSEEPTGGGGIRMHHKFVVVDFDKPTARVYFGSYNFSSPADIKNGENLLLIRDRRIAVAYVVEALRIFDHYQFRLAQLDAETARKELSLARPPRQAGEKPWWDEDYSNPRKARDRELFA